MHAVYTFLTENCHYVSPLFFLCLRDAVVLISFLCLVSSVCAILRFFSPLASHAKLQMYIINNCTTINRCARQQRQRRRRRRTGNDDERHLKFDITGKTIMHTERQTLLQQNHKIQSTLRLLDLLFGCIRGIGLAQNMRVGMRNAIACSRLENQSNITDFNSLQL